MVGLREVVDAVGHCARKWEHEDYFEIAAGVVAGHTVAADYDFGGSSEERSLDGSFVLTKERIEVGAAWEVLDDVVAAEADHDVAGHFDGVPGLAIEGCSRLADLVGHFEDQELEGLCMVLISVGHWARGSHLAGLDLVADLEVGHDFEEGRCSLRWVDEDCTGYGNHPDLLVCHLCHREEHYHYVVLAGTEAAAVHIRTGDAAADCFQEEDQEVVVEEGSCTAEPQPSS